MRKFVSSVSKMVMKERITSIFINKMDISRLMTHAQDIEVEKLKKSVRSL